MESRPQNPEFIINPENFHPCIKDFLAIFFAWEPIFIGKVE